MSTTRKEKLIDTIWTHSPERVRDCISTKGVKIHITSFGSKHEYFKGADYYGVSFNIGQGTFKGNVLFLEQSSDWIVWSSRHRSEAGSVVLIIVSEDDMAGIEYSDIPVVVMEIPKSLEECYLSLQLHTHSYCAPYFNNLDSIKRSSFLTRMLIERLEDKYNYILGLYRDEYSCNENTTLIFLMFDTLMIATPNRKNMATLFKRLKEGRIFSHLSTQEQYDAVILGASGLLLNDRYVADEYIWQLRKIFQHFERNFDIKPMREAWESARYCPARTIWTQLVQLSAILFNNKDLMFKFTLAEGIEEINSVLKHPISEYWQEHCSPDTAGARSPKLMTQEKRDTIIINAVVPFLFFYNKTFNVKDEVVYVEKLLELLYKTKCENNKLTRLWTSNDIVILDASESQAYTQICKTLCKDKLCEKCFIGINAMLWAIKEQSQRC